MHTHKHTAIGRRLIREKRRHSRDAGTRATAGDEVKFLVFTAEQCAAVEAVYELMAECRDALMGKVIGVMRVGYIVDLAPFQANPPDPLVNLIMLPGERVYVFWPTSFDNPIEIGWDFRHDLATFTQTYNALKRGKP